MSNSSSRLTLQLPAQITQENASSLLDSFLQRIRPQGKEDGSEELHVDALALKKFDSCALALLLALRRQAQATKRAFSISNLPASLRSLAQAYGVDSLLATTSEAGKPV